MSKPVVVKFIGDPKQLHKTIDDTKGRFGGMKTHIAGIFAGLGVGALLIGGLKSVIGAAKETQAVTRETETRIKEMGASSWITSGQIGDLATAISNKTGKDDEAIQSGANMLLTFGKIRNEVGKGNDIFNQATAVATDMAAKFGGDASQNAIRLGKALNDPVKGMTALSKIGVSFDPVQQKTIKNFVAQGNILGAQKVILAEVGKQTAGAAAASTTGWDKFLVKLGNIQESIGLKLLPVMDKLAVVFGKSIDFVGRHGKAFAILAGIIATVIAFTITMSAVTKVFTAVQNAAKVATAAWAIAQKALNLVMALNPIGLVIVAIVGLIAVIVLAYRHSETFRRIVQAAFRAVTGAAQATWRWLKSNWPLLLAVLTGPIGIAVLIIIRNWDRLKAAAGAAFRAVVTAASAAWRWIRANWPLLLAVLTGPIGIAARVISGHWAKIKSTAVAAFNGLIAFIRETPGRIVAIYAKAGTWLYGRGRDILNGLFNGIKSVWSTVVGWFQGFPKKILSALGIKSPPDWAISAGKHIMNGILKGLSHNATNVSGFFKGLAGNITGPLSSVWSAIFGSGGGLGIGANIAGLAGKSGVIALAKKMVESAWGAGQWPAFNALEMGEAGWNVYARNAASGAFGLPQALPPGKLPNAAFSSNMITAAAAQLQWMIGYIKSVYGTPVNAYRKWLGRSPHWYAKGLNAVFGTPTLIGVGESGPEQVTVTPIGQGQKRPSETRNFTVNVYAQTNADPHKIAREVVWGMKFSGR